MVCLTGELAHSEGKKKKHNLDFDLFPKSTASLSVNHITFGTEPTYII